MSKTTHATGSTGSYVAGFILSLVFTAIAYYLVINKTVSGSSLLGAIIGLALLQMLVQIFFFLHLGRGPKPLYNVAFFVATAGVIVLVVGGSLFIMSHLHYNMVPTETTKQLAEGEGIYQVEGTMTGACQQIKANHKVTIVDGRISPLQTEAQLCDTLSFINQGSMTQEISFGTAAKPGAYAGQTGHTMRKGMSETVTLNQTGTYHFYDHMHPEISGSFTVTPQ